MIRLPSCILDRRQQILVFKIRVILEDLLKARTRSQQLQDIGHSDAHTANARAAATLTIIYRDAIQAFR
jgi:hypothetical protein